MMKRIVAGLALALVIASPVAAAPAAATLTADLVDGDHPLYAFVHIASDGTLGAKVNWSGKGILTLSLILVDQSGPGYIEIDDNGEACSIVGLKPITCYVGAQFEGTGSAPMGWYIVKVEAFNGRSAANVKVSVYGDVDEVVPWPSPS